MAYPYYFNMEVLALDLARESVSRMTDYEVDDSFDPGTVVNNLKNGFSTIVQCECYVESFLNTILNRCIRCEDNKFLRAKIHEKIEIESEYYKVESKDILNNELYKNFREMCGVRNEMIHFKKTYMGENSIPIFAFNGKGCDYFTKTNMNRLLDNSVNLCRLISDKFNLRINEDVFYFAAEARDGFVNYVYDPKLIG